MAQLNDTTINGTLSIGGYDDVREELDFISAQLTNLLNLFKPTLTTDGLIIREKRCIIEDGGYWKHVFLSIKNKNYSIFCRFQLLDFY